MAEARRSYRTATPAVEEPIQRDEEAKTAPKKEQSKGTFINISGLFKSKSGKAHTVHLTDVLIEKLSKLQVGDTLGVSDDAKNDRMSLWYIEGKG